MVSETKCLTVSNMYGYTSSYSGNIPFLFNSISSLDFLQMNYFTNFYNNVLDLCLSNYVFNISLVIDEFIGPYLDYPVLDLSVLLPSLESNCDYHTAIH